LELIAEASSRTGQRLSLSKVGELLNITGLSEKDNYTAEEVGQFLSACQSVLLEGKSYGEVARDNGCPSAAEEIMASAATKMAQARNKALAATISEEAEVQEQQMMETFQRIHLQQMVETLSGEEWQRRIDDTHARRVEELNRKKLAWRKNFQAWAVQEEQKMLDQIRHRDQNGKLNGSSDTINLLSASAETVVDEGDNHEF
jgi:hypothetical protein